MKKYILSALAVCSATMFTACDDMLDTDPRVTEMTDATFPGKPADVEALNAATYSIMNDMGGGDSDTYNPFYWWELMSDNCYGSGGLQDNKVKALNNLTQMSSDQFDGPFKLLYGGIARANNQIATIDNFKWEEKDKAKRDQLLGEGYFMRALYTFWVTQMYGDVPLITSTTITEDMKKQVSAKDYIYPQILSDLVSAKNLMSTDKNPGHANKYAAEAFMGRAYMFWAGFYHNVKDLRSGAPDINLVDQEGCKADVISKLTKDDVVKALEDIYEKGGYDLLPDYRSLWQYSNSLLWDECHDGPAVDAEGHEIPVAERANKEGTHAYAFIADMDRSHCFDQPGMGNGNKEEIFQIQFMNASKWAITDPSQGGDGSGYSQQRMYSNYLATFWGLRSGGDNGKRETTYPFNEGWGQGTPSVNIWDDWTYAENQGDYKDIRKLGSMIDCANELSAYMFCKDDCEESGYAVKKWNSVELDACENDKDTWWSKTPGYTGSSLDNKMQGDHFNDFYLMRYADVLLMLSELTGDVKYMNKVQERAHVPLTPIYTLEALQNERRWEFAFEGLRFNDMRRWSGIDGGEDCYAAKALQAQKGQQVIVKGDTGHKIEMKHQTCSWAKRYADTKGFLAKPQSQINLMEGALEQNPGWEPSNTEKNFKNLYN